ncbi:hypothetical protein GA0061102_10223 [Rhizobium miluonense]|uniref:Uncharacterized protein n=1 Tax=Rhizobium miluonense TaxID=411945 RepID=A0A1C3W387_9HYPH|nr:hypothetical protein GA0061102_10223 [Rhizobium miluonense]
MYRPEPAQMKQSGNPFSVAPIRFDRHRLQCALHFVGFPSERKRVGNPTYHLDALMPWNFVSIRRTYFCVVEGWKLLDAFHFIGHDAFDHLGIAVLIDEELADTTFPRPHVCE